MLLPDFSSAKARLLVNTNIDAIDRKTFVIFMKVVLPVLIGIGGYLAIPPLPHHQAYGSRTMAVRLIKSKSCELLTGVSPFCSPVDVSSWSDAIHPLVTE